eukprot:366002-Chlamydomonas_euryale.AAC.6
MPASARDRSSCMAASSAERESDRMDKREDMYERRNETKRCQPHTSRNRPHHATSHPHTCVHRLPLHTSTPTSNQAGRRPVDELHRAIRWTSQGTIWLLARSSTCVEPGSCAVPISACGCMMSTAAWSPGVEFPAGGGMEFPVQRW